jgi:CheY-like chemotaxis protein
VKRVLLVDDDDDLREALCDVLAFGGYDVTGAANGPAAITWIAAHGAPDLILVDLMMPGMGGAELKARLDRDPALKAVPVLVISGDTRLAEQAAAMGAVGWISKPTPMDSLLRTVARHVDGHP